MKRTRATIVFAIACSLFVTCGVSSASPRAAGRLPVAGSVSPASVYSPASYEPDVPCLGEKRGPGRCGSLPGPTGSFPCRRAPRRCFTK